MSSEITFSNLLATLVLPPPGFLDAEVDNSLNLAVSEVRVMVGLSHSRSSFVAGCILRIVQCSCVMHQFHLVILEKRQIHIADGESVDRWFSYH